MWIILVVTISSGWGFAIASLFSGAWVWVIAMTGAAIIGSAIGAIHNYVKGSDGEV